MTKSLKAGAITAVSLGVLLQAARSDAQFSCGSNGSRGALVVPQNETVTLDVPDNGIFHFTTIEVSGILAFHRNTAFNPPAILLATGDVVINPSGSVNANGMQATPLAGGAGGPGRPAVLTGRLDGGVRRQLTHGLI